MKTTRLAITKLRTDGGTQPRAGTDPFTVDEYAAAMKRGAKFPPAVVFFDGTDHWLADGYHRRDARAQNGERFIECEVRQGTQRDAVLYSVGANASHGLPRSNADKRRAVMTLLADAEWSKWSNREVARCCAVTEGLVRKLREEPAGERTAWRNGRAYTMKTAGINARRRITPEAREVLRDTTLADRVRQVEALAALPRRNRPPPPARWCRARRGPSRRPRASWSGGGGPRRWPPGRRTCRHTGRAS